MSVEHAEVKSGRSLVTDHGKGKDTTEAGGKSCGLQTEKKEQTTENSGAGQAGKQEPKGTADLMTQQDERSGVAMRGTTMITRKVVLHSVDEEGLWFSTDGPIVTVVSSDEDSD